MTEHKDEMDEWTPPTSQRVHARALVLSAVVARGFLEQDAGNRDAESLRLRIRSWLTYVGASTEIKPEEQALLLAPLGTLTPEKAGAASWRSEGLAILAWALGRFDLPVYDELVEPKAVADAIGYLRDDVKGLEVTLRPVNEINQAAAQAFALHWRLRSFGLDHQAMNFRQFAQDAWFGPLDVTHLHFVNDDLAIGEQAIFEADEEDLEMCQAATMERHQALNWLTGQHELYSEVTTDT